MRVFLSYASEDIERAEPVALALRTAGHLVFFDRDRLDPGETYHDTIRTEIQRSDCMVFLISPRSVVEGSYCLSELEAARRNWPNPDRRVLPVLIEETEWDAMPAYLRAVTVLQTSGNLGADVESAISTWVAKPPAWAWIALLFVVTGGIVSVFNVVGELMGASPLVGGRWTLVPSATLFVVIAGLAGTMAFWGRHTDGESAEDRTRTNRRRLAALIVLLVLTAMSVATSILAYRDLYPQPVRVFDPEL